MKHYIAENLTDEYWNLSRQDKQAVWRSIIQRIEVDVGRNIEIFLGFNYTNVLAAHGAYSIV